MSSRGDVRRALTDDERELFALLSKLRSMQARDARTFRDIATHQRITPKQSAFLTRTAIKYGVLVVK